MDVADRNQRVKDARGEAAKEIEHYKTKQQGEFDKFDSEVRSSVIGKGSVLTLIDLGTAARWR